MSKLPEGSALTEELAMIIDALLDELRRRGVFLDIDTDIDLSSYREYRAANPRKDA